MALGVILSLVGSALFVWSLALTIRANRDRRVPLWSNPTPAARHSIWTRVVGAVLIAMSAVALGPDHLRWWLPFAVFTVVLGVGAILEHNRRVKSAE